MKPPYNPHLSRAMRKTNKTSSRGPKADSVLEVYHDTIDEMESIVGLEYDADA